MYRSIRRHLSSVSTLALRPEEFSKNESVSTIPYHKTNILTDLPTSPRVFIPRHLYNSKFIRLRLASLDSPHKFLALDDTYHLSLH